MAELGNLKMKVHLDISAGMTDLVNVGAVDFTVELPIRVAGTPGGASITVSGNGLEERFRRAAEAFESALTGDDEDSRGTGHG